MRMLIGVGERWNGLYYYRSLLKFHALKVEGMIALELCLGKYALDIISETCLLGAKPTTVPMEQNHRLTLASGPFFHDPEQYRWLIGRLIYLCFTRPELAYCVHTLSQFMHKPQVKL